MAFTEGEKYKMLRFLGWSGGAINPNDIHYSKTISDRLSNITEGAETECREILTKIIALDTAQTASAGQGGVKRVDDIEFFEAGASTNAFKLERRRLVRELSSMVGIVDLASGGSMGTLIS